MRRYLSRYQDYLASITSELQQALFKEKGELDFSYAIASLSRFRVNAFHQRGAVAIAVRIVTEQVQHWRNWVFPRH